MPDSVLNQGIELIRIIQGWGDWLVGPMSLMSFLGQEEFYLFVMPALYWCFDAVLGFQVGAILLLSWGSNNFLKLAFHEPRPYWISRSVRALAEETTFGLPSGHAQNAVAVWGLIAARLRHVRAWLVAVPLMVVIGVSRLYLGVHFPTDVYLGWLLGFMVLVAFLAFEPTVRVWWQGRDLVRQILLLLAIAAGLILASQLVLLALGSWQLPAAWQENSRLAFPDSDPLAPLHLEDIISIMAAFFGFSSGYVLMRRQGGFDAGGPWLQRGLRLLVGMAGLLVIWRGLGSVFPEGASWAAYSLRFVRYMLIGLWITWLAPLVFLRAGWVRSGVE